MSSTAIATGNALQETPNSTTVPTVWFGLERTRALLMDATILGDTPIFVKIRTSPIHPRARSTATGCMVFSDTRRPAPVTGPAGTAQRPNSSVSADFYTTRKRTLVTGRRMLRAVRNILCARTTQTATFPLASPATGTGPAREDILGSRDAPPCWSSTRTGRDVCPLPQRTARFPPHVNHPQTTEAGTPARGLPTPGEEEGGGGSSRGSRRRSRAGPGNKRIRGEGLNSGMKIFVLNDRHWKVSRNNYLSMSLEGPFLLTIKSNS